MLKRCIAAFFALLFALIRPAPQQRRCEPKVTGSFLQSWYCADWDDERWEQETAWMREAGLEYLVLQSTAYLDADGNWEAYYPSGLPELKGRADCDVIAGVLKACQKAGVKVFIGLADFENWWGKAGFSADYLPVCRVCAAMQREICDMYAPEYGDTLYGWYFVPEIDNVPTMKLSVRRIAKGMDLVLDAATEIDPSMPVLFSPFYTDTYAVNSVLATLPMWQALLNTAHFRAGDIIAPQDAVGAGWTREKDLDKVWRMFRAAADSCKTDVLLWANCECFTSTADQGNVPADLDRFVRQMKTAADYVDNIICFSMNHFYSPFTDAESYAAYLAYLKTV